MLCWRVLSYTTHFQIYVVLVLDVDGVLEVYHKQHFQIYVVLEVLDVVLEGYHKQHTFKCMLCWKY